ncbi:MAG: SurA N-terminal domain-containing protein [Crocinitomicaceae bacterium]
MALIGKIREKSVLLVIIIGLALLAFIAGDFFSTRGGGTNQGKYGVGHIFGEKIDINRYNALESKYQESAWPILVDSVIMNREYEALGISISDKELNSYLMATDGFGICPDQNIQSFFKDSLTGQITEQSKIEGRVKLKQQLSELKKDKTKWPDIRNYYANQRKKQKYLEVVSQGIYVSSIEAEDDYRNNNERKDIDYVFKTANSIPTENVEVKDADLAAYFTAHKWDSKLQSDASYKVMKFFSIDESPSSKDTMNFNTTFAAIKEGLKKAENDTIYSNSKSDIKLSFFNSRSTFVPEGHFKAEELFTYPSAMDSAFSNASTGDVIGPYACGEKMKTKTNGLNYYAVSKVIGKTSSRIKARHILLQVTTEKDSAAIVSQANVLSEQLKNASDRNSLFESLARANSADASVEFDNLLELTLIYPEQTRTKFYGKEISEFCTNNVVGSIKVIESTIGTHIVEILERDEKSLPKLATIFKEFKPSEETMSLKEKESDNVLSKLYQGINKLKSQKDIRSFFDSTSAAGSYRPRAIRLLDNSPEVPETYLNSASAGDRLIRAAYKEGSTVGTLVGRPIRDNNTYVIGMVYSTRSKGAPNYNEVEDDIRKQYINAKKSEMILKDFEGKTIQNIAQEQGLQIKSPSVSLKNLSNIDAKVVGSLFSAKNAKENVSLDPIVAENGVYKIFVKSGAVPVEKKSFKVEKEKMNKEQVTKLVSTPMSYNQNRKPSEESYLINGLYKKANVIDNRKLLQMSIRN